VVDKLKKPSDNRSKPILVPGYLRRIFRRIFLTMNILGTLWIVAIALAVNADVLMRGLFGKPIAGVPEMVGQSIVAIVFLQGAHTLMEDRFTRTDVFTSRISKRYPKMARILDMFNDIAGLVVMLVIAIPMGFILRKSIIQLEFIGQFGHFTFPAWPFKLILFCGALALFCQYLFRFVDKLSLKNSDQKILGSK